MNTLPFRANPSGGRILITRAKGAIDFHLAIYSLQFFRAQAFSASYFVQISYIRFILPLFHLQYSFHSLRESNQFHCLCLLNIILIIDAYLATEHSQTYFESQMLLLRTFHSSHCSLFTPRNISKVCATYPWLILLISICG
jgi:hypothetical protein